MGYLTRSAPEFSELVASVAAAERGGVVTFEGLVRDHHEGKPVTGLGYSAYEPMAEKVCGEIVRETEQRWPVRVALQHRLGELAIGETAVAIAVGAAHRDEAFAACRYVIEELKKRVPIWKRERYSDGTVQWVDPTGQPSAQPDGVSP